MSSKLRKPVHPGMVGWWHIRRQVVRGIMDPLINSHSMMDIYLRIIQQDLENEN